jgi:hypothetical protein
MVSPDFHKTNTKNKKKLYLHYSFEYHRDSLLRNGLFPAGVINKEGSFGTRDVYPTGWQAKWFLALSGEPRDAIYIVFPRYGFAPTSEGRVPRDPISGMGGRGYQYIFGNGSGGFGTVFGPIPLEAGERLPWMN